MSSDKEQPCCSKTLQNDGGDSGEDFANEPEPNSRSVYLITYSRADLEKVATKEVFAEIILEAFTKNGNVNVKQYIVCKESHKDGAPHFHMCIKLAKQKKWKAIRKYLEDKKGIKVNFRDTYSNYYSGYVYLTKEDKEYVLSEGHPNLTNPPRTGSATEARRQRSAGRNRKKSFDALDLSELIVRENIRTKTELLCLAKRQKNEGKRDLALYVVSNIDKCVKVLATTWEMEAAECTIERSERTRIEILQAALEGICKEGESCQWLQMAIQTLQRNSINMNEFASKVKDALINGRGKQRNIIIIGPANCGKTFLFAPLRLIYKAFVNPASGSFAWIGVESAEIIYLNDFRWDEKLIKWSDLLRLLEGDPVHFNAPKTHYAQDILLTADTPVFATSIAAIRRYQNPSLAQVETEMMKMRWKVFEFQHQISIEEMVDVAPCEKCFAKMILEN